MDLKGKTVVVTGATNGIGRATAEALAGRGATVVLACRNVQAAERVAAQIRDEHPLADVVVGPKLDLSSPDSIRKFAAAYQSQGRALHVLLNNAGTNNIPKAYTQDGVGMLCQVNYLGPYALTRLLEPLLIRSAPSRIVNVSSVMHRTAAVQEPSTFLHHWVHSTYAATKLANVLFSFEAQRRLARFGVESCAVDPGSVATGIWKNSSLFSKPPLKWVINHLYAPPSDGAQSTIHAATVPFSPSERRKGFGATASRQEDQPLRYYARGVFAFQWVTANPSPAADLLGRIQHLVWGLGTAALSLVDWPIRRMVGGSLMKATYLVPASPPCYDRELASRLWEQSAEIARVPLDPQCS